MEGMHFPSKDMTSKLLHQFIFHVAAREAEKESLYSGCQVHNQDPRVLILST